MAKTFMLTTTDNPFNPFTQFEEWYAFDADNGYNTPSYLARVTITSDELTDVDNEKAIDDAMNEIVNLNLSGRHIKVSEDFVPNPEAFKEI